MLVIGQQRSREQLLPPEFCLGWVDFLFFSIFIFYIYLFIFERQRERERDRAQAGIGRERERETQNPKQAPGSEPSAQSPTRGSNSQTVRSWPEPKSGAQLTEPPRRPGVGGLFKYQHKHCSLNLRCQHISSHKEQKFNMGWHWCRGREWQERKGGEGLCWRVQTGRPGL